MATRYWVGGTNTWNATAGTKWATTSGGAGGATVPAITDDVVFDNNSGTGDFTVTLAYSTTGRSCNNFSVLTTNKTMTFTGARSGGELGINGSSVVQDATRLVWTNAADITFGSYSTGTKTHDWKNVNVSTSDVFFLGNNGTIQFVSGFNCAGSNGDVTFNPTSAGVTLDINSQTFSCSSFTSNSTLARTIAFGATGIIRIYRGLATIAFTTATVTNLTLTGSKDVYLSYIGSTATTITSATNTTSTLSQLINLTIDAGSATVSLIGSFDKITTTSGFTGTISTGTANIRCYGDVSIDANAVSFAGTGILQLYGATAQTLTSNGNTFPATTIIKTNGTDTVTVSGALTCSGILNLTTGRLVIPAATTVTSTTFSASGANTRGVDFGAGSSFVLTASGTVYTTSTLGGLTYTGSPDFYLTNNSALSKTITGHSLAITANTIANFTVTGGSGNLIVTTAATLGTAIGSLTTTSGFTGQIQTSGFAGQFVRVYGNFDIDSACTGVVGTYPIYFTGSTATAALTSVSATSTIAIRCNSIIGGLKFTADGTGKIYNLGNNLSSSTTTAISFDDGTFNTNNYNISNNAGFIVNAQTYGLTLNLGSSTLTLGGPDPDFANASYTLNAGTSSIVLNRTSSTQNFYGGGRTFYNLDVAKNIAATTIINGSNTFNTLSTSEYNGIMQFTGGGTTTVTNFLMSGDALDLITLTSTDATQHNLVKAGGGTVNISYAQISYMATAQTDTWYALLTNGNVDNGNNTNIIFTLPSTNTNFLMFF